MKLATAVILAVLSLGTARASGYVGVYALIDKVVMEPNADNPERIQIFGVFSIATDKQVFQPAQRGYLYFTLSNEKNLIRREWADLAGRRWHADRHCVWRFRVRRFLFYNSAPAQGG